MVGGAAVVDISLLLLLLVLSAVLNYHTVCNDDISLAVRNCVAESDAFSRLGEKVNNRPLSPPKTSTTTTADLDATLL